MPSQLPIQKYIIPFLDYCEVEKGLADNTQKNYSQYLRLFARWLAQTKHPNLLPRQLTQRHIWDYRLFLARQYKTRGQKFLTKKSQNYYLIALRALLDYFAEKDIASLPSSKIKLAKEQKESQVSFLELSEVEKILAQPNTGTLIGLRDRAIAELLFSTGMRISELTALDKEQVAFLLQKEPSRTLELSITGKGKRVRTVYISPRAGSWLKKYLDKRGADFSKALFANVHSKNREARRLTPRSIQTALRRFAKMAGLSKKVTPHTLRHTYATDLLSHGADLRSVQEFLGHKNVATTQIYTHVTNKRLRALHEKFHGGKNLSG